ncbi:MAG: phage holin family protein [Pseudomonadales bacterium]|nr:phage holin family protein [Candidatus Woesebacteria bacterium]MCB9800588.1 phage holin family protein [Pseudomonadales bacterium]
MKLLKPLIRTGITLALLTLLPNVTIGSVVALIIAAIVFEFLFSIVKPVLKLLFLPVNVVTLGIFGALLNIFLLWLVTYLVPGFHIGDLQLFGTQLNQFWSLVATAFVISIIQSFVGVFI